MINPIHFFQLLKERGINFFSGVPDSLFKDFCSVIQDNTDKKNHIIAANEGAAVALAAGYYLSTQRIPFVYMQNSGLGNAVNPLTSLVHQEVYHIPILLMIGWRGEPGQADEPQHCKQGKITLSLLEAMDIPYEVLSCDEKQAKEQFMKACEIMESTKGPFALVVRNKTFLPYELQTKEKSTYPLTREQAIGMMAAAISSRDIIVSTTGKASRELYEFRENSAQNECNGDFLTVGSMGHSSQIALGMSLFLDERNVYCFDGDGALLMHLGALAINGQRAGKNFKHVLINNGSHESVGGQPTVGFAVDFGKMAESCGYASTFLATNQEELQEIFPLFQNSEGPSFLEVRVNISSRNNLLRPSSTPQENRDRIIHFIKST